MSENRMLLVRADQLSMTIHRGEVVVVFDLSSSQVFPRGLGVRLLPAEARLSPARRNRLLRDRVNESRVMTGDASQPRKLEGGWPRSGPPSSFFQPRRGRSMPSASSSYLSAISKSWRHTSALLIVSVAGKHRAIDGHQKLRMPPILTQALGSYGPSCFGSVHAGSKEPTVGTCSQSIMRPVH
jgi:hypothetical protein